MRPAKPSTGADVATPKTGSVPLPTKYLCKFRFGGAEFIAHASGYTRDGAAAEAAELLRGEDGFEPQFATLIEMEVM